MPEKATLSSPKTNKQSVSSERPVNLAMLSEALGTVKKRILELPATQYHKDYFIALLSGIEETSHHLATDPGLPQQIHFATTTLANLNEAAASLRKELEWYQDKKISILNNDKLETQVRTAVITQLQKQFLITQDSLHSLEKSATAPSSLLGIINKRITHLANSLDLLIDPKLGADSFVKKVRTIELHLTDINNDVSLQITKSQLK